MRRPFTILSLLLLVAASAQQTATVFGVVRDPEGVAVPQASISVVGTTLGVASGLDGTYELEVPAGDGIVLRISHAAYEQHEIPLSLAPGARRRVNVLLAFRALRPAEVTQRDRRGDPGIEPLDPRVTPFIASPIGGDVSGLLKGQLGVSARNELSTGYTVRGGNYDENLVYVNDVEVYRPFLVRAGQQEGLSFPNPDLIERIGFNAGGFDARFGDKMSSVLDIHYRRPRAFHGSMTAGLLGGSVHLESPMLKGRLRQITGFRYRTTRTVLSGLDTQGEYDPRYTDLQTYWTYDLSDKVELGLLGIYSRNRYDFIPEDRETELGTFNQALRFTVYFDGKEQTAYETLFGALNLNVKPDRDLLLKFTTSAYTTHETERYDILGQYYLSELNRDLGSDEFGEVVRNLGIGTFLDHARNELDATVISGAHKGFLQLPGSYLQWGVDARGEVIHDRISEWTLIDSAEHSIPQSTGEDLELQYGLKSRLDLESVRASAYVQNAWDWKTGPDRSWSLTAGVRAQHWTYNEQTVVSPRARLSWHPGWKRVNAEGDTLDRDYLFWFAAGLYYQPPFYRELRDPFGVLNPEIRAQRSIHFLLGMDRLFSIWDRPFKFAAEAYFKQFDDLIPYEVENVSIRYYATNNARGFATGADFKLNGEFIPGIESWASLGVLATYEDLVDDFYYIRLNEDGDTIIPGYTFDQVAVDSIRKEPGFIPRPTDQRVSFSLFFQDEMPRWPTFKVHLSLFLGTGLPYGPPNYERYPDTLRTPLYRRVDIGFSKQFLGAPGQEQTNFLRHIDDLWLQLEIFNLLNINNVVDYRWVQDVNGNQYAIPEFLTPRRLNLKLIARF